MLIYYCVWLLLIFPYFGKWRLGRRAGFEKYYACYTFIILTLLIGLRDVSVGADTSQYEYLYETSHLRINSDYYDRGYYLFSFALKEIGIRYREYLLIVACIVCGCLIRFYNKYSKNLAFSVFIFMTIGLLPMYMTGIRQTMAISFCLVALLCMEKNKYILATAIILLASRFHASAICFLIMLPISKIRLTRNGVLISVIVSSAAFLYSGVLLKIVPYVLPEKYESIEIYGTYNINPLLIIIAILIPLFCVIFDKVETDGKFSMSQSRLYIMSCLNVMLTILSLNSMYFSRLAYYFVHANSILIPNAVFSQKKKNNRIIMLFVIVAVCALYFIISIPDGILKIDKYKFFWQ